MFHAMIHTSAALAVGASGVANQAVGCDANRQSDHCVAHPSVDPPMIKGEVHCFLRQLVVRKVRLGHVAIVPANARTIVGTLGRPGIASAVWAVAVGVGGTERG